MFNEASNRMCRVDLASEKGKNIFVKVKRIFFMTDFEY